jgi:hypothetical protein
VFVDASAIEPGKPRLLKAFSAEEEIWVSTVVIDEAVSAPAHQYALPFDNANIRW